MYRPTVRYADVFKSYVDDIFKKTTLDRTQIFRLALFTSAHSDEFRNAIEPFLKKDVLLSPAMWSADDMALWMELEPKKEEGERDVYANDKGKTQNKKTYRDNGATRNGNNSVEGGQSREIKRRVRTFPITQRTPNGGISIRF